MLSELSEIHQGGKKQFLPTGVLQSREASIYQFALKLARRQLSYSEEVFEVCRADTGVFVLHPSFARANFYAQQVRVLHLLKAMLHNGVVHPLECRELAIVGGGIAGLTAAAGALSMGLGVRLFEPEESLLSKYKQAIHREIHPNIISWPFNELRAVTNLPFLNWGIATANRVAERIRNQWDEHVERHAAVVKSKVQSATSVASGGGVRVRTDGGAEYLVDAVIFTVGFEREVKIEACNSPSYWVPHAFEGSDPVWVSGTGDGGLIDAACQTFGVAATKAVRELAYRLDQKPQKGSIHYAETEALKKYLEGDEEGSLADLDKFYEKLGLEPEDTDPLEKHKIAEPAPANLVHQHTSAYSPLTCPINKVLVSVMAEGKDPKVIMKKGTIKTKRGGDVVLETTDGETPIDVRRCIVRHGAKHATWGVLSDHQKARLESANREILNKPVPDFVLEEWRDVFSERQLIPDQWFADYLFGIVIEILAEAGFPNAQIQREISQREWKVNEDSIPSRAVKSMFPIKMGDLIVSLTDSSPVFEAL